MNEPLFGTYAHWSIEALKEAIDKLYALCSAREKALQADLLDFVRDPLCVQLRLAQWALIEQIRLIKAAQS